MQAIPEDTPSQASKEPRYSLLDGRYHELPENLEQESSPGDSGTTLATRDMSSLTLQKGESILPEARRYLMCAVFLQCLLPDVC